VACAACTPWGKTNPRRAYGHSYRSALFLGSRDVEVNENAFDVDIDAANDISFTGNTTSNSLDFGTGTLGLAGVFVLKLDPTGKTIWARTTETATTSYPEPAAVVDSQGNTLLARGFLAPMRLGGISLPSVGRSDMFVVKLGP
jgi:hypothetical protein